MPPAASSEKITLKGCDNMSYHGFTDAGNIRENNEDSFFIREFSKNFIAAVVADGMGGYKGGEEASSLAGTLAMNSIEENLNSFKKYSDKQKLNFLKNLIEIFFSQSTPNYNICSLTANIFYTIFNRLHGDHESSIIMPTFRHHTS